MRLICSLATAALVGLSAIAALPKPAVAQKRVALVIGNSAYQHTGKLANPKNDATDMAAALKKHGFQVVEGFDLDKAAFDRKVRDFAAALQHAEVGVFFFAGHGLQVAGHNYLVPIDAQLTTADALEFEMVRLDVVHRVMERLTNTNVLFLDACRDNPLARNLARAMGTRSGEIGRGLAAVESGVGTLISFSTQPGNVALDGTGRNSPFAGALVKHMAVSNDDLSAILISVRNDVMKETQRRQVPWEHSALTGRFFFSGASQAATPAPQPQFTEAERAWAAAQGTKSIAVLEDFIARYTDTFYAGLARERIEELKKQQIAVAPPPPAAKPAPPSSEIKPAVAAPPATKAPLAKPVEPAVAVSPSHPAKPLTAAEQRTLKSKDIFKECDECPEMIVVPAGSFMMGYTKDEPRPRWISGDQVQVTIAKPFAVGRFAVTRGEFAAFAMATGKKTDGGCKAFIGSDEKLYPDRNWRSPGFTQDDGHPVVCVNWNDASAYVAWLSSRTGKPYRLLFEAEREYVSRAGTTTPFWWGTSITPRQANYDGNFSYAGGPKGEYRRKTVPVNTFDPNPWGLYNVHGNVWELTDACVTIVTADQCSRIVRGGSWNSNPRLLPHASSFGRGGDERFNTDGFRVARSLD